MTSPAVGTGIVAFIEARLGEREAVTRESTEREWQASATTQQVYALHADGSNRTIAWCANGHEDDYANAMHIARNDPRRVLAEVAKDRATLALHQQFDLPLNLTACAVCSDERMVPALYPCQTVRLLAAIDADHPDYDPDWKPVAT